MTVFGARFFATTPVPFLMIGGDLDVVVDYRTNALRVLETVPNSALVTIAGASHAGFDETAGLIPGFIGNPDLVGCWLVHRWLDLRRAPEILHDLGAPGNGMMVPRPIPEPCRDPPRDVAMAVARQQLVTRVAVTAFFESRFATDPAIRDEAARYLTRGLAADFPEAEYLRSSPRVTPDRARSGS
jgi:hypothetical protein